MSDPIWKQLQVHQRAFYGEIEAEEPSFEVMRLGTFEPSRPLLVVIHPGDACEHDAPSIPVRQAAWEQQTGMAQEIMSMPSSEWDIVLLHRSSSAYALKGDRTPKVYQKAIRGQHADSAVTVLYGDDLDAASSWLLEHAHVASRPQVFMTGAWTDPEHGCVAIVGQALAAQGA